MKSKISQIIFCLLIFALTAFAQDKESQLIDKFARISCGEFMARMQWIFITSQDSPDSKIYVVYYGGRYRRESLWNKKTNSLDKIRLKYPHREDGLNWAKSIPLYLTSGFVYKAKAPMSDKIVLINGGFREDAQVEIWLVPKDGELPKPTPTIAEADIKFRDDKPSSVPNFTNCYYANQ